jgi:hypothetical protein
MTNVITCLQRFRARSSIACTIAIMLAVTNGLLLPVVTLADPVIPTAIDYDFEGKDTPSSETCGIVMTIAAPPALEVVNFRLIARLDKLSTDMTIGFTVSAGVLVNQGKKTAGVMVTGLTSARFKSRSFDTSKRLIGVRADGGGIEMRSGLPEDAAAFYHAFVDEPFVLSVTPQISPGAHEYAIVPDVPLKVQQTFQQCLDAL